MTKVWIVTAGEYSDYHIVAPFDTPEAAAEFANAGGYEIEEWELGVWKAGEGRYEVNFDSETGAACASNFTPLVDVPKDAATIESGFFYDSDEGFTCFVEADSRERAIKGASEAYARFRLEYDKLQYLREAFQVPRWNYRTPEDWLTEVASIHAGLRSLPCKGSLVDEFFRSIGALP